MRKRLYLINFILALAWGAVLTTATYFMGARGEVLASAFSRLGPFLSAIVLAVPPFVVMLVLPWSMAELKGEKGTRFFFLSLLFFLLGIGLMVFFWTITFTAVFSHAGLAW